MENNKTLEEHHDDDLRLWGIENPSANSHCPDPHGSRYRPISYRLAYSSLMRSGLFFEFYPELTGVWHDDKNTILNENKPISKTATH
jgi:hypothetical protein